MPLNEDDRRCTRVGESESYRYEGKVVVATNKDLSAVTKRRKFRQDLYNRVAALVIDIPPLSKRPDDIEEIILRYSGSRCRSYRAYYRTKCFLRQNGNSMQAVWGGFSA